eukprot:TRINITY_DN4551_c0_g1_i1.p3 TRINITY_DN4551_c0_g1~~TRINITY_DN4551_c0_g1_i1.p3  ORF type:complete len:206 (-),score=33.46 TRINITY_DN4551_c0_g1_i1:675-1292(-)
MVQPLFVRVTQEGSAGSVDTSELDSITTQGSSQRVNASRWLTMFLQRRMAITTRYYDESEEEYYDHVQGGVETVGTQGEDDEDDGVDTISVADSLELYRRQARDRGTTRTIQRSQSVPLLVVNLEDTSEIEEQPPQLEEADAQSKRLGDFQCLLCFERPVQVALVPCGHSNLCRKCSRKLTTCPFCRKQITRRQRLYLNSGGSGG